jgi:hypothetical protein
MFYRSHGRCETNLRALNKIMTKKISFRKFCYCSNQELLRDSCNPSGIWIIKVRLSDEESIPENGTISINHITTMQTMLTFDLFNFSTARSIIQDVSYQRTSQVAILCSLFDIDHGFDGA